MHSLRCLRVMQMKKFMVVGFVSVLITFILLFYYSTSQESLDSHGLENSKFVFHQHISEQDFKQSLNKENKMNELVKEPEVSYDEKDSRPPLTVARLAKYCNHEINHMQGQEGLAPANYKLLAVHTVIRHGDRSPIYKFAKGLSAELNCLVDTEQFSHISKVVNFPPIMAQEMAKASDTNSFSRWSLYPSHEACGEGQLTGRGAIQHILNGMHFSERYFHQNKLFTDSNWQKKVLIHSTEVSRTYQSAIAFAYGLLPHFDINKLTIKTSHGMNFCEDRKFGITCHCPKIEEFRLKGEAECKTTSSVKKSFQKYKKLLAYVSKVMDLPPASIPGPTSLMDGLSGYTCHNKPYPCNANGACITPRVMEALWDVIDAKSECLGNSESFRTHSRAEMHGLLYRIARNFNISISNGSNANFHLYSGHDTTVTPLIMALQLKDVVWPGYAHMITFELWKDVKTPGNFVRVLQNGRVVTDQVLFCKGKVVGHGMCEFKHFLTYFNKRNLRSFCYAATESEKNYM